MSPVAHTSRNHYYVKTRIDLEYGMATPATFVHGSTLNRRRTRIEMVPLVAAETEEVGGLTTPPPLPPLAVRPTRDWGACIVVLLTLLLTLNAIALGLTVAAGLELKSTSEALFTHGRLLSQMLPRAVTHNRDAPPSLFYLDPARTESHAALDEIDAVMRDMSIHTDQLSDSEKLLMRFAAQTWVDLYTTSNEARDVIGVVDAALQERPPGDLLAAAAQLAQDGDTLLRNATSFVQALRDDKSALPIKIRS